MPLTVPPPGRECLKALLSQRNQDPRAADRIDREILKRFQRRIAVLALDLCNFTGMTRRLGIIHYLAIIEQMADAAAPAIERNGGIIVKQEADNLFAAFACPARALDAALDIFHAFEAVNAVIPDERDLSGCIGIGYGDTILVGHTDMFGPEVNLACKLGEDLAERHEILLTRSAYDALPSNTYRFTPRQYRLADIDIDAFRFNERVNDDLEVRPDGAGKCRSVG